MASERDRSRSSQLEPCGSYLNVLTHQKQLGSLKETTGRFTYKAAIDGTSECLEISRCFKGFFSRQSRIKRKLSVRQLEIDGYVGTIVTSHRETLTSMEQDKRCGATRKKSLLTLNFSRYASGSYCCSTFKTHFILGQIATFPCGSL